MIDDYLILGGFFLFFDLWQILFFWVIRSEFVLIVWDNDKQGQYFEAKNLFYALPWNYVGIFISWFDVWMKY